VDDEASCREEQVKARQNRHILANQIIDLTTTLRLKAGHHLTEQFLAEELQVSRTPVRAALDMLEKQGVVVSRTNHGYFLARPWSEIEHLSLEVPTTHEQDVYTAIIRDRLLGSIPEKITQKELEIRYKTNRNTLLRALSRLADEGLVDRSRGRGWRFMPTLEGNVALRDSYNFRVAIEPTSFGMPTFVIDVVTLKRSQASHEFLLRGKTLREIDPLYLFELDSEFHEMIARFSNNRFMIHAVQHQNRLRRLLEFHTYTNFRRVREWLREHLAVIEVLGKNDLEAASQAMMRHLQNAAEAATFPQLDREEDRKPSRARVTQS
jgi:DNA-binding GntR family transcriptional regulator